MAHDSRVAQLLDEIFDERLTPEEACRDHPELLQEVRKQWQRMSALQAKLEGRFPTERAPLEVDPHTNGSLVRLPQITGYEMECVLGQGGMGVVYKARHLKLNRTVAIKMLPAGTYAGPHELARFLGEAKAVAALRHANIVQVHDVGDTEGRPYFTMEFLEGGNLAQRIAGQPQPGRQATEIAAALAGAIQVAHQNGIIHRDLKPANVLLAADGTPKISDFGLARRFENDEHLTFSGTRLGTPSYMAPEQALGKRGTIGPAVDIYSLGAVLYELLTGRPPFRAETALETERQLLTEEPVPPRRLNASVPRDLETICLKCLDRNPDRRYATAAAVAADLHRFGRGEPIAARPVSFPNRVGRWVRRRPAQFAALSLGLLMILFAVGGGLWLVSDRQANRRAIESDLQSAARSQQQSNWSAAQAALERARDRMGGRSFSDLREILGRADRDQEIVARLERIRSNRANSEEEEINNLRCFAEYDAAFRDSGIAVPGEDPTLVATRIRGSNIQAWLTSAVEDWAALTQDHARLNWLLQIARAAAPDPTGWRDRALTLKAWSTQSDLSNLIATATVTEDAVPLLLALGEKYAQLGGNPVALFAKCQKVRSGDFWANYSLGSALREHGNATESMRYLQAAMAIRPDSALAYNQLGIALTDLGRVDDAIEMFRAARKLAPATGPSLSNLSMLLSRSGRHAEAISLLRECVALKKVEPRIYPRIYSHLGYSLNAVGQRDEAWKDFNQAISLDPHIITEWDTIRGQFLQQGRGDEARALWRTALAGDPPQHAVWDGYAEFSLFLGREDEYRWARRELLKRFGGATEPHIAERTGRACLFLPGTEEELKKASALIGRALAADPSKLENWVPPFFKFAKGLLAYRQGRFSESADIMKGDAAGAFDPAPGLVLAMDQFYMGQKSEARKSFDKALKKFDWQPTKADFREPWMYHILRREAERLIKPGAMP
jgi:eukaryotic-like serine/threonine-protein kinase